MQKPAYNPDLFPHWTDIRIRFRDLDPLNHVNNSVFNTYLEEARIDFIRSIPEFDRSMKSGSSFVLVHLEISYLKPIRFGEQITVGTAIRKLGTTSIQGFQAIYSKENHELKAVAETAGVWIDLSTGQPTQIPEINNTKDYEFKINPDGQE